jgi:hypothetical protein
MFLENLFKLERNLWNEMVSYEGVDKEMAEFTAQDRNDVIKAKELYKANDVAELKKHVDYLDTYIRDGVVMAFVADLGEGWVFENLGYTVN